MAQKGEIIINPVGGQQKTDQSKEDEAQKKLDDLVSLSEREIFKLSTVFPFDLFPDTVSIYLSKISIIEGNFLKSETVHIVPVQDIVDVWVNTALFFAMLSIIESGDSPVKIRYLKKNEALKAARIIRGLLIAKKQEIDLLKLKDIKDIGEKLETLGRTK